MRGKIRSESKYEFNIQPDNMIVGDTYINFMQEVCLCVYVNGCKSVVFLNGDLSTGIIRCCDCSTTYKPFHGTIEFS